jgi:glutamyl-tRNA reductase
VSVLVLGLNHKTASVELLERLAVPEERRQKALASLLARQHVAEAVVLSTCNRVEVYASVSRYHGGLADLRAFMGEWGGLAPEDFVGHTYDYFDEGAAAHLFGVASGLDSMVFGERQINLQVKEAFKAAQSEEAVGRLLQRLFSQSLKAARRVRAETSVGDGASSMVDLGLELADRDLHGLSGRDVLVVGAGKIGGMAAVRLADRARTVTVANRTVDRAERLAQRLGDHARVVALDDLSTVLPEVDLVIASTGATSPVIHHAVLARQDRRHRPLVLLDLGVPRDIEPALGEVPGVMVRNVEDLRTVIATGPAAADLELARDIVGDEARQFSAWRRSVRAEPTIRALRTRGEAVRRAELERLAPRLATLGERERDVVESLTRGIVNTLLHEPTIRLKELVDGEDAGAHALALRELFDLPDE